MPRRKSILELAGVSSWAELRAQRAAIHAKRPVGEPAANELSAAAADKRAKGRWFTGYAKIVRLETAASIEGDLEIANAYVLYDQGLRVTGALRLGDTRSIIVVVGDLDVSRLELGDDVLVVTGAVTATEYIASRPNEGIFSVHGVQAPAKQLAHVRAPWYLAYDQATGDLRVHCTTRGRLAVVPSEKLVAAVRVKGRVDAKRVLARLAMGKGLV